MGAKFVNNNVFSNKLQKIMRHFGKFLAFCCAITFFLVNISTTFAEKPPKLVVVLVYDQMRGDCIERWEKFYGKNGFNRIAHEGANFSNCYYEHATSITACGHSIIGTGIYPAKTGIISNNIYNRETKKNENCSSDSVFSTIGDENGGGFSPKKLLSPTLGDILHRTSPNSNVVCITLKERAGIMLGGQSANTVLWYNTHAGGFTTSSFYAQSLPKWVQTWNSKHSLHSFSEEIWLPALADEKYPVPDDEPWERAGKQTFPHQLPKFEQGKEEKFLQEFEMTPFAVDWEFDFARNAVLGQKLGADNVTDILYISVSSPDLIGHAYGADSREVMDIFLHCDKVLGEFIDFLDAKIGRKNYELVVTSDHGVAPVPEKLQAQKIDAGRIVLDTLLRGANKFLCKLFEGGKERQWIEYFEPPNLYLKLETLKAAKAQKSLVLDSLQAYFLRQSGIGIVLKNSDFAQDEAPPSISPYIFELVRKDYFPPRSGELMIYPKRYWIYGRAVATHGTPYEYDRYVPLIFFGGNIASKVSNSLVSPADIVPTLGKELGLQIDDVDGKCLLLKKE